MDKVWLKSYQKGVPHTIDPHHYASLVAVFETSIEKFADKPAMTNLGTTLTYGELDKLTRDFAAFCQEGLGLQKGERIALMMPNCLQFPVALFGALRAGLVVVNTNPLYSPTELSHQLEDSGAVAIVALSTVAHTLQSCLPLTHLKHIIITELGDLLGFPKKTIVNFVVKRVKQLVPAWSIPSTIWFSKCMRKGRHLNYTPVDLNHDDLAFLQYTGGTTGIAKGAMLSHGNISANLQQAHAWIKPLLKEGEEIIITALPMYHIFSLTANCLVFMKNGSHNVLITNPRDLPAFIKEIAKLQFSAITGVNTLFNAMLHHSLFDSIDFSKLKIALAGGMALQSTVAKNWLERTGRPVIEAYGLTETSPAVCINPMNLVEYNHSIGLPIPSTEVKVINDKGEALGLNTPGELCVRGPQVMQGYWQKPDETARILDDQGWLRTGDVATINKDGYVTIVDRLKDMILVSGFNVYPNEVEEVIAMHPGVNEVAVIGINNPETGEKVRAYIVLDDTSLTKASIIAHCKQYLTNYKIPKEIIFREALPKTNVGKILRRALKEEQKQEQEA